MFVRLTTFSPIQHFNPIFKFLYCNLRLERVLGTRRLHIKISSMQTAHARTHTHTHAHTHEHPPPPTHTHAHTHTHTHTRRHARTNTHTHTHTHTRKQTYVTNSYYTNQQPSARPHTAYTEPSNLSYLILSARAIIGIMP